MILPENDFVASRTSQAQGNIVIMTVSLLFVSFFAIK